MCLNSLKTAGPKKEGEEEKDAKNLLFLSLRKIKQLFPKCSVVVLLPLGPQKSINIKISQGSSERGGG